MRPQIEVDDLLVRLSKRLVSSCTCHVKTHEVVHHDPGCLYRILSEAMMAIEGRASLIIRAPWSEAVAVMLNSYQSLGFGHPYTCGNRGDGKHPEGAILKATEDGWVCEHCEYQQGWAHYHRPPLGVPS